MSDQDEPDFGAPPYVDCTCPADVGEYDPECPLLHAQTREAEDAF